MLKKSTVGIHWIHRFYENDIYNVKLMDISRSKYHTRCRTSSVVRKVQFCKLMHTERNN